MTLAISADIPSPRPIQRLRVVHFDIVGGCQLRCIGCPNSTLLPKVKRIDVRDFASCMDNIDIEHITRLQLFNFGEPLLHHNLPGIFEALKPHRHRIETIEISTNAQFVRWDQLEAVIAMKMLNRLAVSCDGDGTPESFERLRPPARWPLLIEFLKRVSEMKRRLDPALMLITRTILSDPSHMKPWNDLLRPLGWQPHFRGWKILPEAAENPSGRTLLPGKGVCTFVHPADSLFIDVDGTVVPCCVHPRAGEFGNLMTTKFSDIVGSPTRSEFVKKLEGRRDQISICSKCEYGPRGVKGPSSSGNLFSNGAVHKTVLGLAHL